MLFKKKETEISKKKLNTKDYKIKLNLKSMCFYEHLTGKSFFEISEEEDYLKIIYSCFVMNNPELKITYNAFKIMLQDPEVAKWIIEEYERIGKFNSQIEETLEESIKAEVGDKEKKQSLSIVKIADVLIVECGIDPHYVMYDMELWEIMGFMKAFEEQSHTNAEMDRFWTYLTVMPHLNPKKRVKPTDLVEFEWEKEAKKNNSEKDLEAKKEMILRTFKKMNAQRCQNSQEQETLQ